MLPLCSFAKEKRKKQIHEYTALKKLNIPTRKPAKHLCLPLRHFRKKKTKKTCMYTTS